MLLPFSTHFCDEDHKTASRKPGHSCHRSLGRGPLSQREREFPLPQAPSPSPSAFFSGGSCHAAVPSLSPRQPSPGNAKKRTSRSSVKNQQRIKPKQAAEKNCLLPIYAEPAETGRQALPHSPLRRKQTHKAQGGNYKTPDLTPAGARQTCSCYEKGTGNTSRKRSSATSRKGENAFRARAATQKDAPPECLTRAFPRVRTH